MLFDKRKAFVAILDTMWGSAGKAPTSFLINPANHSGHRLYSLTQSHYGNVAVVNACPQQTNHARKHGTPNVEWLMDSLLSLPEHWKRRGVPLLVCGKVAQSTWEKLLVVYPKHQWNGSVIYMDHPAARTWTKAKLDKVRQEIARAIPAAWRK